MSRTPRKFIVTGVIAIAANVHSRTVLRRAKRERWPRKRRGNALLFQPPRSLRAECAELDRVISTTRAAYAPGCSDGLRSDRITPARRSEAVRLANRIAGVLALAKALDTGEGREAALVRVAQTADRPSPRSLRRWFHLFEQGGVAGLVEQKRGRPATKPGGVKP